MHHCPKCDGQSMVVRLNPGPDDRQFWCKSCGHTVALIEVPEPYLRELVLNSIKLASLVKLPG